MEKRKYLSPILMDLEPGGDDIIPIGGSQGTDGDISIFDISALESETQANIRKYCGYLDLKDMDTSGDYKITQAEFEAWYENNPWW